MSNRRTVTTLTEIEYNKKYKKLTLLLEPLNDDASPDMYRIQGRFKSLTRAEEYIRTADLSKYNNPMLISAPYNEPQEVNLGNSTLIENRATYIIKDGEIDYSDLLNYDEEVHEEAKQLSKKDDYRNEYAIYAAQFE